MTRRTPNRGDIYFIEEMQGKKTTIGHEQKKGRPAIIISNDAGNKNSPVIEIVYLTTAKKTKNRLPTHVEIDSATVRSTALCEQITSVDKQFLGRYIGHITDEEQERIDMAMAISIGLEPLPGYEDRTRSQTRTPPPKTIASTRRQRRRQKTT